MSGLDEAVEAGTIAAEAVWRSCPLYVMGYKDCACAESAHGPAARHRAFLLAAAPALLRAVVAEMNGDDFMDLEMGFMPADEFTASNQALLEAKVLAALTRLTAPPEEGEK